MELNLHNGRYEYSGITCQKCNQEFFWDTEKKEFLEHECNKTPYILQPKENYSKFEDETY